MPGPKRRTVIGILIFVQAILFGSTTPVGNYSLLHLNAGNPTFSGLEGPGWRVNAGQLGFDQVFALAAAIIIGVLVWRGLPFALYSTAALAALSVVYGMAYTGAELLVVGPRALFFLLFFPLPTVPPSVIALPVLILAVSVILENRRVPVRSPRNRRPQGAAKAL